MQRPDGFAGVFQVLVKLLCSRYPLIEEDLSQAGSLNIISCLEDQKKYKESPTSC